MTTLNQRILKYNTLVPRYTSYPTAPHFSSDVGQEFYVRCLEQLPQSSSISLYIHIPYCPKLCWYCGCHTKATRRYAPVEHYIKLLKRELDAIARTTGENIVSHIHFGGGSPTILSSSDFSELMEHIRRCFQVSDVAEIAVELDPRGVTECKVAAYAKYGVNRISLGVQDFHDDVQQAIDRVQSFHCVYEAQKLLKIYGINRINIDLMYGLPKQTLEGVRENLTYALLFNPSRIALFSYAHVPHVKKHMRQIDETMLPDSMQRLEMSQVSSDYLRDAGYFAIGLDHFVREDDSMKKAYDARILRRNFQGYTDDNANMLIGAGISSISQFPQGYVQNTTNNQRYEHAILNKKAPVERGVMLSKEDCFRQHIIGQLMCYLQVNLKEVCEQFEQDIQQFKDVFDMLNMLEGDGLVRLTGTTIKILPQARHIVRVVCAMFDQYYSLEHLRHTQVA